MDRRPRKLATSNVYVEARPRAVRQETRFTIRLEDHANGLLAASKLRMKRSTVRDKTKYSPLVARVSLTIGVPPGLRGTCVLSGRFA